MAASGDLDALERLAAECAGPRFDPASLDLAAALFTPRMPGQWEFRAPEGDRAHPSETVWLGRQPHVHTQPSRLAGLGSGYLTNGEGRSFELTLGPGVLRLRAFDAMRRDRSAERAAVAQERRSILVGEAGIRTFNTPGVGHLDQWGPPSPSRMIWEWSARSRTRMREAFASVDWSAAQVPGQPLGMITVGYPGDWLAVAPSGAVVKGHLRALRGRLERLQGATVKGAWKMEFQRRGAPHFHILCAIPALGKNRDESGRVERFESWLSRVWADIVKADDVDCHGCGRGRLCGACGRVGCRNRSKVHQAQAGDICRCGADRDTEYTRHLSAGTAVDFDKTGRMSDPKRLGIYFQKHGSKDGDGKEYQNQVPAEWLVDEHGEMMPENGPGRFWGFWGMPVETRTVTLDYQDFTTAKRILHRVARARARTVNYQRGRHAGWSPHDLIRRPRTNVRTLRSASLSGGFVIVNDGVRTAEHLAAALSLSRSDRESRPGRVKFDPARLAFC